MAADGQDKTPGGVDVQVKALWFWEKVSGAWEGGEGFPIDLCVPGLLHGPSTSDRRLAARFSRKFKALGVGIQEWRCKIRVFSRKR